MQKYVKKSLSLFSVFAVYFVGLQAVAQDKATRPSPPAQVVQKVGNATVTVSYGQPSVKGRKVWGELVPYGQVWRTGANEATTFEVDKDVSIEGQPLAAGKYGFFTIPNEKEWTIIFNKVPAQWGAFKYDAGQDALRVTVKPKKSATFNEKLLYTVSPKGSVGILWENVEVDFKVK
ncbi:DUF2911 domain-containing protein [Runella sp. CRIBMP]|uniref:DUF2911 domain-containing protein n=1 Tax=Runella sp. CRIBMP TaxID=2683261 RepID=UPI001411BB7D|nr:DUF2911 domain-containing protein [Runella sp. CRIBMP]NBB21468.1 DUF2911 domain-containing protein [Runella sp. CRIBMP]